MNESIKTNNCFSEQETNKIISTNFIGPLTLIQLITPQFRAQKSGIIVNISSGGAISPSPSMAVYGASKAALETLSLGLTKELSAFNIRMLIVQPGAFTTNMGNAIALTSKKTPAYKDTIIGQFTNVFDDEKRDANGVATAYSSPNDVDKGCQGIFEVVTGTGRGEGKEGFERLILSADIAQRQKDMCEINMKGYEAFREVWGSTGHDGGVRK
jgi:NADP-dependent 3-hydroxy acid dehydrogenase YdfG